MTHLFKSRPGWGLPSARYARLGQAPSGFTEGMLHYLAFLRSRNIEARVAALIAEPTDNAEEFEANRNVGYA